MAILFTPRNKGAGPPWFLVGEVTLKKKTGGTPGGGFKISGPENEAGPSPPSQPILISTNPLGETNGQKWTHNNVSADGEFLQILGGPLNITVDHNTAFQSGNIITADGAPSQNFIFRNNIAPHNTYGVIGTGHGPGNSSIQFFFPGSIFKRNVIVG